MNCKHCGKEIDDQAVICVGCGRIVSENRKSNSLSTTLLDNSSKNAQTERLFLTIVCISFFASIICIISSLLLMYIDVIHNLDSYFGPSANIRFDLTSLVIAICFSAISLVMSTVTIFYSEKNRKSGEKNYLICSVTLLVFSAVLVALTVVALSFNTFIGAGL